MQKNRVDNLIFDCVRANLFYKANPVLKKIKRGGFCPTFRSLVFVPTKAYPKISEAQNTVKTSPNHSDPNETWTKTANDDNNPDVVDDSKASKGIDTENKEKLDRNENSYTKYIVVEVAAEEATRDIAERSNENSEINKTPEVTKHAGEPEDQTRETASPPDSSSGAQPSAEESVQTKVKKEHSG